MKKSWALPWLLASLASQAAWPATVRIRNDYGSITVRSVMGIEKPEVQVGVPSRPPRPDDVKLSQEQGVFLVQCQPADGARVDLDIRVPHTTILEATTKNGAISLTGLVRDASLVTDSGDVRLAQPWRLARVRVILLGRPKELVLPKLDYAEFPTGVREGYWTLLDAPPGFLASVANPAEPFRPGPDFDRRLPLRGWLYGNLRVRGNSVGRLELAEMAQPEDAWVKAPEDAPAVLDAMMGSAARTEDQPRPPGVKQGEPKTPALEERLPVFVSDVRMVNLTAPVYDSQGRPISGLKPEDFEVLEDGAPQKVAFAGSEELPFNLVLLLDFSTTTLGDRYALIDAARGFIDIARPRDRVAVYALAESYFQVISPLTADRKRLVDLIEGMPALGGASPLFDTIVLAYAQESQHLLKERSALVVVSDGIDNALHAPPAGSKTPFEKLLRFVAGMPVLVYPVLLPPPATRGLGAASAAVAAAAPAARRGMQQFADVSGGRLFPADTVLGLEPVYPLVAEELRRVYTISYYPQNQNFDGKWRRIQVRVKRAGVTLRTREGYYAR